MQHENSNLEIEPINAAGVKLLQVYNCKFKRFYYLLKVYIEVVVV
jgi:hypothetical protein